MANADLSAAKNAKNDEFYTQYEDIQKEVNAYLEYNPILSIVLRTFDFPLPSGCRQTA